MIKPAVWGIQRYADGPGPLLLQTVGGDKLGREAVLAYLAALAGAGAARATVGQQRGLLTDPAMRDSASDALLYGERAYGLAGLHFCCSSKLGCRLKSAITCCLQPIQLSVLSQR